MPAGACRSCIAEPGPPGDSAGDSGDVVAMGDPQAATSAPKTIDRISRSIFSLPTFGRLGQYPAAVAAQGIPRAAMSSAASGGLIVVPATQEDFLCAA